MNILWLPVCIVAAAGAAYLFVAVQLAAAFDEPAAGLIVAGVVLTAAAFALLLRLFGFYSFSTLRA